MRSEPMTEKGIMKDEAESELMLAKSLNSMTEVHKCLQDLTLHFTSVVARSSETLSDKDKMRCSSAIIAKKLFYSSECLVADAAYADHTDYSSLIWNANNILKALRLMLGEFFTTKNMDKVDMSDKARKELSSITLMVHKLADRAEILLDEERK